MEKGELPCPGIDTDARWGCSHTKGGYLDTNYILHVQQVISYTLTADVTTANEQDNQMYSFNIIIICFLITLDMLYGCYSGYDDKNLYKYSKKTLGIDSGCPVGKIQKYGKERLDLVCFYKSVLGQATIYSQRRISIEPLIEHIKSVFRIDPLPARGFSMISAIVLLSVLLYQAVTVYYNCKKENSNPKSIRYMLGTI